MDRRVLLELEKMLKEAHRAWSMDELRAGRNNIDQAEFAKALRVSDVSFSKWYTGKGAPNPENQKRLAESPYIGNKITDILGTPRIMPDDPDSKAMHAMWMSASPDMRKKWLETLKDLSFEQQEEDREQTTNGSVNSTSW